MLRPTWAAVNLAAIRANVTALRATVTPAEFMAVVKADGYGHGAIPVARAALDAGAAALGVALVEEAETLRADGVDVPILVLSDVADHAWSRAAELQLAVTVSSAESVAAALAAGVSAIHLKIDTGMHRAGCAPDAAVDIARGAGASLAGVWTHLAEADDTQSGATEVQLRRFDETIEVLRASGLRWATTHAANSAGGMRHPASRYDLVRCGIAMYGIEPSNDFAGDVSLQPALTLHSRVRQLRTVAAGEAVSYGGTWRADAPTRLATIPIGYADGVPRRLGLTGGEVLIRGHRCPIRGVVTMDQTMVEVPAAMAHDVALDDEVVLLGVQGTETIRAWDWATGLDTIAYEIVTGISARVPRVYL